MLSRWLIKNIEAYFRKKTGQPVCYLPSARLGIYASLCELFPPGAGLILSPVTDDIVLFAILAAGLKPIFTDMETDSGGLRPDRILCAVKEGAAGVLTSNLYGIPDDAPALRKVCDEHGLLLIEDCAHAMGCTVSGQMVGTFGEISVFSLAKHIGGLGGIVTGKNPKLVEAIRRRAKPYIKHHSFFSSLIASVRLIASESFAHSPRLMSFLKALLFPFFSFLPSSYTAGESLLKRDGHRVPIQREDFVGWEKRNALELYHRYLEVDNPRYREIPCWYMLMKNVRDLGRFEKIAHQYRTVPERIISKWYVQFGRPRGNACACYYKLPLFIEEREQHSNHLLARGVNLDHIYYPPFPDYVPSELYINLVTDKASVLRWSKGVIPIAYCDIEKTCDYFLSTSTMANSKGRDVTRGGFK